MRPTKQKFLLGLILLFACSTGCLRRHHVPPAALIRLTKAVQSEVAYNNSNASDEQLLEIIYSQSPELRTRFGGYSVHIKRDGNNVVTLVCSRGDKAGLLEDASWTLRVDRQWYKTNKKHPCAFDPTLNRSETPASPR